MKDKRQYDRARRPTAGYCWAFCPSSDLDVQVVSRYVILITDQTSQEGKGEPCERKRVLNPPIACIELEDSQAESLPVDWRMNTCGSFSLQALAGIASARLNHHVAFKSYGG